MELQGRNKELEREKKALQEKNELFNKSKMTEQGSLEAETRLQEELDNIKTERDAKYAEFQRLLDRERENYKQKLRDLDGKGTSA